MVTTVQRSEATKPPTKVYNPFSFRLPMINISLDPHKADSVKKKIRWPVSVVLPCANQTMGFPEPWNGMMKGTYKLFVLDSQDSFELFLNLWF